MNGYDFHFCDVALTALPSGALWMQAAKTLCISDLHLGKSDRIARHSGRMLPPYETQATLDKLAQDIAVLDPACIICLGDSFDDLQAADSLTDADRARISQLQAGREWIWIEGNHDPGPVELGGSHRAQIVIETLTFRHIWTGAGAEVSGHYHPKYAPPGAGRARSCFLLDRASLIAPAYGAYTGGLHATDPVVSRLFTDGVTAILTGRRAIAVPVVPRNSRTFRAS